MASYTKEELAQMIAQLEDSGQNAGVCIMAALRKDVQRNRPLTDTMDEIAYNELKNDNKRLKKIVKGLLNKIDTMEKDSRQRVATK